MSDNWTVDWRVIVDGVDLTDKMRPYLISVRVTDQDGEASDSCQLTLDDNGGRLKMPRTRREVQVIADGARLFLGLVDSVRSTGTKAKSGRLLRVTAKGFDTEGRAKEPLRFHRDDATLQDFLGAAAQYAGLSGIKVHPALASIERDYWVADAESFLQVGQRLAREFDATFKIRGDRAVLVPRGQNVGLGTIRAVVGQNVVSWSIAPVLGRPRQRASRTLFFDRAAGGHQVAEREIEGAADAVTLARAPVADRGQADDVNAGRASKAKRDGGEGSITMDWTPEAQAEAPITLSGARTGIDGLYVIRSTDKSFDKNGGSVTAVQVKRPEDGAGKDER
ncbi:MAG: late control D family protein [Pseudomonadota bacterium]